MKKEYLGFCLLNGFEKSGYVDYWLADYELDKWHVASLTLLVPVDRFCGPFSFVYFRGFDSFNAKPVFYDDMLNSEFGKSLPSVNVLRSVVLDVYDDYWCYVPKVYDLEVQKRAFRGI